MLVLSRRLHQRILIADGLIAIEVVAINGGQIQLGITAPRRIPVVRAELLLNPPSRYRRVTINEGR